MIKNFIEYLWIFVSCSNVFLETFQQLLETSEVESFLSTFPSTKLLRASILQSESASVCSVKKDLHSWRYLRNFSEFQKCARLKSAVSGMQFTKKELHCRLQSRHLRKLFGVNVANCRFLEISRRTTFWNTPVQVIEFLIDLYNVEISPITLLKSDSAREALLAIL